MPKSALLLLCITSIILFTIFVTVYKNFSQPVTTHLQASTTETLDPKARNSPYASEFVSFTEVERLSDSDIATALQSFVPGQNPVTQAEIAVYELLFRTRVETGDFSQVRAFVYAPVIESNQTYPLIVYGAGTTGLDDKCAPSQEDPSNPTFGNYRNQMISQASQGFVVALPNYEGFDNPSRIHYYFNAELEARTLLGTAEVLLGNEPARILPIANKTVFFGGYSQGGHAAFAAADKAAAYTHQLEVGGIFGHGPTTDISDFLRYNPNLAPYFVYAYSQYYDEFAADRILSEKWLQRVATAKSLCVDQAFQFNTIDGNSMYTAQFWEALQAENPDQVLLNQYPELQQFFTINDAGISYTEYPTLFLQGRADQIVTPEAQQEFIDSLCEREIPVSVAWYDGLDHFSTRQRSFTDTNQWIQAVSSNKSIETYCS